MLKTALTSIEAQSARANIQTVVVVENGGNKESELICKTFSSLPIVYVYRETPATPGYGHIRFCMQYIKTDYFAFLCDDDWWSDTHLERGIQSFSEGDDVVASYAACGWIEAESGFITGLFAQFNIWFAALCEPKNDRWIFGPSQMIVANLISTAVHFSSLIVNRNAWMSAIEITRNGNPFDIDRLISVELSLLGSVVIDRTPSAYIRRHPGQEGVRLTNNNSGSIWFKDTTKLLLLRAQENSINLTKLFYLSMQKKKVSMDTLRSFGVLGSIDYLCEQGILPDDTPLPFLPTSWQLPAREMNHPLSLPKNNILKLNVGCGSSFHEDWINLDIAPRHPSIIQHDLKQPLPFANNTFHVVYNSHVLEHLPRRDGKFFIRECFRVLQPNGILRVVVPDLETIAKLYLTYLEGSEKGDPTAMKRYEWIILELLDQMVRERKGGDMLRYFKQNPMPAEDFVLQRLGQELRQTLRYLRSQPNANDEASLLVGESVKGELHKWMYDRHSLRCLLESEGFRNVRVVQAWQSEIPKFASYYLDCVPDGSVRKADSLFMEAVKP
jgi:predicted SAM-dependent methyltransferase/glycosyltransferase involved in cell wall biosynthesis